MLNRLEACIHHKRLQTKSTFYLVSFALWNLEEMANSFPEGAFQGSGVSLNKLWVRYAKADVLVNTISTLATVRI